MHSQKPPSLTQTAINHNNFQGLGLVQVAKVSINCHTMDNGCLHKAKKIIYRQQPAVIQKAAVLQ